MKFVSVFWATGRVITVRTQDVGHRWESWCTMWEKKIQLNSSLFIIHVWHYSTLMLVKSAGQKPRRTRRSEGLTFSASCPSTHDVNRHQAQESYLSQRCRILSRSFLNVMQLTYRFYRAGLAMRILSVRPSVYLSNAWIVTKRKDLPNFYIIRKSI